MAPDTSACGEDDNGSDLYSVICQEPERVQSTVSGTVVKTIAVSGISGGNGKSVTAVNIASVLALAGKKTLLVDLASGSKPLRDQISADKGVHTIRDYLSGKIKTLNKAVASTPYSNLTFMQSGIEYYNFTDRTQRLKKNLVKKFSNLNTEFVVLDLGPVSDHVKLDYLLDADVSLLVLEPDRSIVKQTRSLALNLAARAVETEFRKTRKMKDRVARLRSDHPFGVDDAPLLDELGDGCEDDPALLRKIVSLRKGKALLHLLVNKAKTFDDLNFGPETKKTLENITGFPVHYAGFIPKDDALVKSAMDKIPVTMLHPQSPLAEAYRNVSKSVSGLEEITIHKNALLKLRERIEETKQAQIGHIESELMEYRAARRVRVEEEIESEKRELRVRVERELETLVRERELEIETKLVAERETRLDGIIEDVEKERKILMDQAEADAANYESARTSQIEKTLRRIERQKLDDLEKDIASLRDIESARINQELEELKAERQKRIDEELEQARSKMMAQLEQSMEEISERRRYELRTSASKEMENIREMVWQELEEDREKKINSIKEEISLFHETEKDMVRTEINELRSLLKSELKVEMDARRRMLMDDIYREVMLFSSHFDTENELHGRRIKSILKKKQDFEAQRIIDSMNKELDMTRQAKTRELVDTLAAEKKERIARHERELALLAKKAKARSYAALKRDMESKKIRITDALSKYAKKAKRKIELEYDGLKYEAQKQIINFKSGQIELAKMESRKLYETLCEQTRDQVEEEKRETLMALETEISAIRVEKLDALDKAISSEKRERIKSLDDEIGRRRAELNESMERELAEARSDWLDKTRLQVERYKARLVKKIKEELAVDRNQRVAHLETSIATEEKILRDQMTDRIIAEEEAARKRLIGQLELERREIQAELRAEMRPRMIHQEMEMRNQIEAQRRDEQARLTEEMGLMRRQSIDKNRLLESKEKERMLSALKARMDEEEQTRSALLEGRMEAKRQSALELIHEKLKKEKAQAIETLKNELNIKRSELISGVRRDTAIEKEKMAMEAREEIAKEREEKIREMVAKLSEEKAVRRAAIEREIETERIDLKRQLAIEIAEEKAIGFEKIKQENEKSEAAANKQMEQRREQLWERQKEWVEYETEQLRMELTEKMTMELQIERDRRRRKMEDSMSKEVKEIIIQAESESKFEKMRIEREYRSELERSRNAELQKMLAGVEAQVARKRDALDTELASAHAERIKRFDAEMEKEEKNRLDALSREIEVERRKKLDLLNLEMKTEEYKRRQELISEIMGKKAELEKSFHEEKQRYVKRLRERLLREAHISHESLEEEISRIEKNWRLN